MRSVTNFTIFRDTTKTAKAINNTELNDLFHQDDHLKLSYLQLWKDSLDDPLQMLPMSGKLIQTMPMQGCKKVETATRTRIGTRNPTGTRSRTTSLTLIMTLTLTLTRIKAPLPTRTRTGTPTAEGSEENVGPIWGQPSR